MTACGDILTVTASEDPHRAVTPYTQSGQTIAQYGREGSSPYTKSCHPILPVTPGLAGHGSFASGVAMH